mmetsp:Transcript_67768/g.180454  ORF Transcript_67768/g.180454 Transcript_67768/m.180454 type:complete len:304 (-) Transcript_67768:608-1519(-)
MNVRRLMSANSWGRLARLALEHAMHNADGLLDSRKAVTLSCCALFDTGLDAHKRLHCLPLGHDQFIPVRRAILDGHLLPPSFQRALHSSTISRIPPSDIQGRQLRPRVGLHGVDFRRSMDLGHGCCKRKCLQRLFHVLDFRRHVGDHERSRVPSQALLQQHGQDRISHVRRHSGVKAVHDCAQSGQRLVNADGLTLSQILFTPVAGRHLLEVLRASQVHQEQPAATARRGPRRATFDREHEQAVGSGRGSIHRGLERSRSQLALPEALQHVKSVIDLHRGQAFHEKVSNALADGQRRWLRFLS